MATTYSGPTATGTIGLAQLNNWMRDTYSDVITTEQYFADTLYGPLIPMLKKDGFDGNNVLMELETSIPLDGQAFGDRATLPYGGTPEFTQMYLPLKEVIVPAGVTEEALNRAVGPPGSWGKIQERALHYQRQAFVELMNVALMSDGTGRIARVVSSSAGTADVTVTCDNTYKDFGLENVQAIRKGMWVECMDASGDAAADGNGVTQWKVTARSFGDRANSTAKTGTFTIACTTGQEATIAAFFEDNAVVFLGGTISKIANTPDSVDGSVRYEITNGLSSYDIKTSLPMGLLGIVQTNATADSGHEYAATSDMTMDKFQGLARASYESMLSKFIGAGDFGGTDGTPADWDTSVITDAFIDRMNATGMEPNLLIAGAKLGTALDRKNKNENNLMVTVSATESLNMPVYGARAGKPFIAPSGKLVKVMITERVPDNVLYGINTDSLVWRTKGNADFKHYGSTLDPWILSPGNRIGLFECWLAMYSQLVALRCDTHFCIQDLATNVA